MLVSRRSSLNLAESLAVPPYRPGGFSKWFSIDIHKFVLDLVKHDGTRCLASTFKSGPPRISTEFIHECIYT